MASMNTPVKRPLLERNPSIIFPFVPSPPLTPVLAAVLEVAGVALYDLRGGFDGISPTRDNARIEFSADTGKQVPSSWTPMFFSELRWVQLTWEVSAKM